MNRQDHKSQKNKFFVRIIEYLPEILVLLICAILLFVNISAKQGYHMDELLSFELANAEFNPWIVPTQPQGRLAKFVENELRGESMGETLDNLADTVKDVLENRGASKLLSYEADVYEEPVWIERQTFEDYITVGDEDGFSYLSVYFNVKDDNHPPLHFMALHTISSLFPGAVTPLMGCVINLACVLGIMVLLMKLGRWLMKLLNRGEWGRFAGLMAAGLYGLSVGAVSTTLLIRMYAMVSLWCVAELALHVRKLYGEKLGSGDFTKGNKLLVLVTVLGFWTQYFFLFYCLILAAVTSMILWRQKRVKELVCYIRSMVFSAVLGVAVFPFSISDVFLSGRGVEALENLSAGFAGYGSRIYAFLKILFVQTGVWIVILPVLGVIGLVWSVKRCLQKKRPEQTMMDATDAPVPCGLWYLLWIPVAGYFLLAARMSPYLVDRYIMPLFPLMTLGAVVLFGNGIGILGGRKGREQLAKGTAAVLALVMTAGQLVQVMIHDNDYLYRGYEAQETLAANYEEYPCICVYEGVGYYENLLEFTSYEKTLLVTADELENRQDGESIEALEEAVVLIKGGLDGERISKILQEKYRLYPTEILMDGSGPYGDRILLYERN